MRKLLFLLFPVLLLSLPIALLARQETPAPRIEITGVNATQLPTIVVTANVYDSLGQPVSGLTAADFALSGDLASLGTITNVENVTSDNLTFAVVLAIDVSSSMAGAPIQRAQEAARQFIQAIGPNDPVAIITFGRTVTLVQDYTSDKTVLLNTVDSLVYGGQTPLYQGAYEAVLKAAASPTPRRAVILLSDGAEYGGISQVGRDAALQEARHRGVPIYTIGLGYGFDRTYLQGLSSGTNARNFESPTDNELLGIYTNLAGQLRSQYVITLNANVPPDGMEYAFNLQVTTAEGAASANGTMRAPIPVPIVRLTGLPSDAISQPTAVTADIAHDDPINQVNVQVDSGEPQTLTQAPYSYTIDPVTLAPGAHTLTVSATDSTNDTGTATANFTVAALPSQVTILPDLTAGEVNAVTPLTLVITGQTEAASASFSIDGGAPTQLNQTPFIFTIDPMTLTPGAHTLDVQVTNQGGVTSSVSQSFTVAALPPIITITGLQDGQLISDSTQITADALSQTSVNSIGFGVNGLSAVGGSLSSNGGTAPTASANFTINPVVIAPGNATLVVTAAADNGQSASQTVHFMVAPLPPQFIVNGLTEGETIDQDRDVSLDFATQTPVVHVAFLVDGEDLSHQIQAPYHLTLNVLHFGPGVHLLRMIANTSGGQSAQLDMHFTIADSVALTMTALAPTATPPPTSTPAPSSTPAPTNTPGPTDTPTPTPSATANVPATQTAAANAADVQATATAGAQATFDTMSTLNARAELNAEGTANAQSTRDARATGTTQAQATASAQSGTATASAGQQASLAQATVNAQGTAAAQQAALNAQAATNAAATASALQAALNAQAATNAAATATAQQAAMDAQATINAAATASALQATLDTQATAAAQQEALAVQATANAHGTANAEGTTSAQATLLVQGTATTVAQSTLDAESTAVFQTNQLATLNAQATANSRAEQNAQATANAQATRQARATAASNTQATATAIAQSTAAAVATFNAQATINAEATRNTQLQAISTEQASPTAGSPAPTLTAISTLIAQQAQNAPAASDIMPILVVIIVVVVILLVVFLILRGGRRRRS